VVEVHPCPEQALSDGDQSLSLGDFAAFMTALRPFAEASGRLMPLTLPHEVAA